LKVNLSSILKYSAVFFIGLGICFYLFKENLKSNFFHILASSDWSYAVLAGLFVLIAHVFRALRWQLMLNPIAEHKTSFFNVYNALMVGYLLNLVLPRAGELVRCGLVSKKEKLDPIAAFGTVIAERIFDLLMLLLLIVILLFVYASEIVGVLDSLKIGPIFTNQRILIALFLILASGFIFFFLYKSKRKSPSLGKIRKWVSKLKDGFFASKKIKSPSLFAFYTLLIWFFYTLSSFIGFKLFVATESLNFYSAMFMVVGGSFGMIAPIQGGIGAFHFMVSECLRFLGINSTIGLAYATIIHAAQTLVVIVFGFLSLILGFNFNISLNNEKQQSNHQG
jgi:uncharacterized protein (TIRG00374 family)